MATYVQRAQAICDALLNNVATPAQINRLGKAIANEMGRTAEYDSGTNAVKAAILVEGVRRKLLSTVKGYEATAAVQTAADTANAAVDTDFPETP